MAIHLLGVDLFACWNFLLFLSLQTIKKFLWVYATAIHICCKGIHPKYTAISRKVVGKMCTRQSRKVLWDMIDTLFLTTVAVEPTFVAFHQHSQTHFHGLSCQFFQISLKNSELKTTHNAFRDCHVHFFRQPFSKQLYTEEHDFRHLINISKEMTINLLVCRKALMNINKGEAHVRQGKKE